MSQQIENQKLINYFKLLDQEKIKSYTNLLYVQLANCLFVGSADTTNAGKVLIQDKDGNQMEIIRPDWKQAFINSVLMLQFLMEGKMSKIDKRKLIENPNYEQAKANLRILLDYIHNKTPLFGSKNMTVILAPKGQEYEVK